MTGTEVARNQKHRNNKKIAPRKEAPHKRAGQRVDDLKVVRQVFHNSCPRWTLMETVSWKKMKYKVHCPMISPKWIQTTMDLSQRKNLTMPPVLKGMAQGKLHIHLINF